MKDIVNLILNKAQLSRAKYADVRIVKRENISHSPQAFA
jgi:hypothetical protein